MSLTKTVLYLLVLCLLISCSEQSTDPDHQEPIKATSQTSNLHQTDSSSIAKDTSVSENSSLASTTKNDSPQTTSNQKYRFRYNLNQPNHKANLPRELIEISALTYNRANNTLLAVNDEQGKIFTLNAKDGKFIDKLKFAGAGDYEGIEIIKNTAYVLKANGRITPVDLQSGKVGTTYKTPLSVSNDVEGLGYNPAQNALILACKGEGNLKKKSKLKEAKAFYSFDLNTMKLIEKPKFIIEDKDLEDFLESKATEERSKKEKKKLKKRALDFSPSAIAKHPKSGHYYILSSVGRLLVLCNEQGLILDVQFLDPKKFSQPEGICFAPDGTMYISNEGRSLVANILTFEYQ